MLSMNSYCANICEEKDDKKENNLVSAKLYILALPGDTHVTIDLPQDQPFF